MDYGLFRKFDKIDGEGELPRTSLQNGLFLVELRFSPQDETRSVAVPMVVERTGFGEIASVTIEDGAKHIDPSTASDLQTLTQKLNPPVQLTMESTSLRFRFVEQTQKTARTVPGALIFNAKNELCVLLARLHS